MWRLELSATTEYCSKNLNLKLLSSENQEWYNCTDQIYNQKSDIDQTALDRYDSVFDALGKNKQNLTKDKTRLRQHRVLPVDWPSLEHDFAFEEMIWDFSKKPSEKTVSKQDLTQVLFDGPVLLRLLDVDEKVLGLVHLYGRTARHALRAIHEFYVSHSPYPRKSDNRQWAVALFCDESRTEHVWDVIVS